MTTDGNRTQGVVSETAKALGITAVIPEIYRDLLHPAAQEVGSQLLVVAKAVRIALSPLAAAVWSFDRLSDWLQVRLTAHFSKTPAEEIVAPKPEIAGPLLLHLHFLKDEKELRGLFANLLASAMDSKTRERVHPAYVSILQQLAPDEALLLQHLNSLEQHANTRAEEQRIELERKDRLIAEHLAAGKPRSSLPHELRGPGIILPGFWSLEDIWPGDAEESLEKQFAEVCAEAGVRQVSQSESYLDNLIRLRILVCNLHSTAELEPEGANRYGDYPAHIREGSTRELFLSEFGKGLVSSVCHLGAANDIARENVPGEGDTPRGAE